MLSCLAFCFRVCFSVLCSILITSFEEERAGLCASSAFVFICTRQCLYFSLLLVSGIGCGL